MPENTRTLDHKAEALKLLKPLREGSMDGERFECPTCHRPLMSASEACNGSFAERDHPTGVKAVPVALLQVELPRDELERVCAALKAADLERGVRAKFEAVLGAANA